jgi:hypothetical protein
MARESIAARVGVAVSAGRVRPPFQACGDVEGPGVDSPRAARICGGEATAHAAGTWAVTMSGLKL